MSVRLWQQACSEAPSAHRSACVLLREKLKQLIEKRIGKENFVEKLGFVTKHELYSRAAQKPQPVFPSPEQMLFDHEFTKLVKELEGQSASSSLCVSQRCGGLTDLLPPHRYDHQGSS